MTTSLDQRVLQASIGALETFGLYLGDRLGLYAALRDGAPVSAAELAARCGIHPRYAREWLEQQRWLACSRSQSPGRRETRRFRMPEAPSACWPPDPTPRTCCRCAA